jgi:hypothetical protein
VLRESLASLRSIGEQALGSAIGTGIVAAVAKAAGIIG